MYVYTVNQWRMLCHCRNEYCRGFSKMVPETKTVRRFFFRNARCCVNRNCRHKMLFQ